jgi:acyl-phosphate glycerol 3-phosphate acyltransferase
VIYVLYDLTYVIIAYFIGAIPFGYLIARWARGIDIRTVGSGNIGATNVGRVLGFRFFVLVFTLDLLKGFVPTYGFPRLVPAVTGQGAATLGVLVALGTILGHNFPIYLRFRGGKGVATSLGALLALDATAALAAAGGFGASLLVTRYVSVSSLFGGVMFTVVHFARARAPWGRDQIAMSLLTIALLILLVVRHRKNLVRLRAGTEPRVSLRKRKKPPEGRVALVLLVVVAVAGGAAGLVLQASRRAELRLGHCTFTEVARVATGHQRAERLAFADRGKLLAVTCPRYNRVVLYRVTADETLDLYREIALEGRPVAIWPVEDRIYVLQRPPGDARHLEPGYWETYDFRGRRIGSKYRVGFYPDDLAITQDGRHALVLISGSAEGGENRPPPALAVIALGDDADAHREVGRLTFAHPGDDPERLALSASGRWATVPLLGSDRTAVIDLSDLSRPSYAGGSILATTRGPDPDLGPAPLEVEGDVFPSPIERGGDAVRLDLPELGGCVACTRPRESGLELYEAASRRPLGRLPLRAALNLGPTRPTGVAYATGRGLLAVATRSGSVHLIAIRPDPGRREVAASGSGPGRR